MSLSISLLSQRVKSNLLHFRAEGLLVGRQALTNFEFDPNKPHTYCRLCGEVYQGEPDRFPERYVSDSTPLEQVLVDNLLRRQEWSFKHAKRHPEWQHRRLMRSGRWLTPEAAEKLIPFGIVPLLDIVLDDEVEHAGKLAPRQPHQDAVH